MDYDFDEIANDDQSWRIAKNSAQDTNIFLPEIPEILANIDDSEPPSTSKWRLPTIIKLDVKSRRRTWTISYDGSKLYIEHGIENGKMQTDVVNVTAKLKRTPNQQAWLQARTRYKNYLSVSGISNEFVVPMKGNKFLDVRVKYPVYVDRKYDGVHFVATSENGKIILKSRENKEFVKLNHIRRELEYIFDDHPDIILDGELYIHGVELQDIRGIVNTTVGKHALESEMTAIIFDIVDENSTFHERYELLREMRKTYTILKSIIFSKNYVANNHEEVEKLRDRFDEEGYEGCMIRNPYAYYERRRCNNLLKFKKFDTDEAEFLDIVDGKNVDGRESGLAVYTLSYKGCEPFNCRPADTFENRRKILNNRDYYLRKYKGKPYTIKFFGLNKSGIPNIATGVCFRDYE